MAYFVQILMRRQSRLCGSTMSRDTRFPLHRWRGSSAISESRFPLLNIVKMGCPLANTVYVPLGTGLPLKSILLMAVLGRHRVNCVIFRVSRQCALCSPLRGKFQNPEPAGQSAARSIDTYSLLSREDVVGCLRSPNWQKTLQIEGLAARLRNFCGICGQRISSKPCALRNHVRRTHVQAWKLCPDASHLSSTLSITRSKPCGACGVMTSRNTVHKRSLMFHLCLLKLFLQVKDKPPATLVNYVSGSPSHDTDRGDEPSLPVCHQAAGSGLQHGWDSSPINEAGGSSSKEERPSKWPEENSKGDSRRGKGNTGQRTDRGQKRQEWGSKWEDKDHSSQNWNRDLESLNDSIQLLARISLRHEDELAQSRTEKEYVLTFEVQGGGILPLM